MSGSMKLILFSFSSIVLTSRFSLLVFLDSEGLPIFVRTSEHA